MQNLGTCTHGNSTSLLGTLSEEASSLDLKLYSLEHGYEVSIENITMDDLSWQAQITAEDFETIPNEDHLASIQLDATDADGNVFTVIRDAVLQIRVHV